MSVTRKMLIAG